MSPTKTKREILVSVLTSLRTHAYPENYLTPLLAYIGFTPLDKNLDKLATDEEYLRYDAVITELAFQMPVEYILGKAFFFGHTFTVTPDVLIPRVDTEPLVEKSLQLISTINGPKTIIDIGTGSGALIISIAHALKNMDNTYWATDISEKALFVAQQNATDILGESHPITFFTCDVVPNQLPTTNDVFIITNPPYISKHAMQHLPASVVQYEPHLALEEQTTFIPLLQNYISTLQNQSKTVHIAIEYNDTSNSMIQRFASPLTASLQALLAR